MSSSSSHQFLSLSTSISSQGFHFTLSTLVNIPSHKSHQCTLHVVYDLGSHVYVDQYELAQLPGYTSILWGTSDLERPLSAVDSDGTTLLLTVDSPSQGANITLDVPFHARYGNPVSGPERAYSTIELKRPIGFLACAPESVAPVPDLLRPYTSMSGWPTSTPALISDIDPTEQLKLVVPVGKLDDLAWVDMGTAVVMIAMFSCLLIASVRTARRLSTKSSTKTH